MVLALLVRPTSCEIAIFGAIQPPVEPTQIHAWVPCERPTGCQYLTLLLVTRASQRYGVIVIKSGEMSRNVVRLVCTVQPGHI